MSRLTYKIWSSCSDDLRYNNSVVGIKSETHSSWGIISWSNTEQATCQKELEKIPHPLLLMKRRSPCLLLKEERDQVLRSYWWTDHHWSIILLIQKKKKMKKSTMPSNQLDRQNRDCFDRKQMSIKWTWRNFLKMSHHSRLYHACSISW